MKSIKKINKHLALLEEYVQDLVEAKEYLKTRVDNLTNFLLELGYTKEAIDKVASSGTIIAKSNDYLLTLQRGKLKAHFTRKVTPCEMAKLDQFNIDEECIPTARVIDFCVVDIDGVATKVTSFNVTYKNTIPVITINGKQVRMSFSDINQLDEDMCK